jgi:hypothetical protein
MKNMYVGDWSLAIPPTLIGFNKTMLLVASFFIVEWYARHKEHPLEQLHMSVARPIRWTIYYAILLLIAWFAGHQQQFIYFQF